jgi:hypothetical protein
MNPRRSRFFKAATTVGRLLPIDKRCALVLGRLRNCLPEINWQSAATDFWFEDFAEAEQQNGKKYWSNQRNAEHIDEIDHQIEHFGVNGHLIDLLRCRLKNRSINNARCIMIAKVGHGSAILEEISNLFKSKMLTCGSVKQTIASK